MDIFLFMPFRFIPQALPLLFGRKVDAKLFADDFRTMSEKDKSVFLFRILYWSPVIAFGSIILMVPLSVPYLGALTVLGMTYYFTWQQSQL